MEIYSIKSQWKKFPSKYLCNIVWIPGFNATLQGSKACRHKTLLSLLYNWYISLKSLPTFLINEEHLIKKTKWWFIKMSSMPEGMLGNLVFYVLESKITFFYFNSINKKLVRVFNQDHRQCRARIFARSL